MMSVTIVVSIAVFTILMGVCVGILAKKDNPAALLLLILHAIIMTIISEYL